MRRRLLLGFLAFTVLVLVVLEVPLGLADAQRQRATATDELARSALALSAVAGESLEHHDLARLQALVAQYTARTGTDIAVLGPSGQPVATAGKVAVAGLRSQLPAAGATVPGQQVSGNTEVNRTELTYVGVALGAPGGRAADATPAADGTEGILVIASPTRALEQRIHDYWAQLAAVAAAVLGAAGLVGMVLARSLTRPLARIESSVAALGSGDLTARAPAGTGPTELRQLASTFNTMADRLSELVESQRAFVADASHQLRTPLTALRLRLENLESARAAGDRPGASGPGGADRPAAPGPGGGEVASPASGEDVRAAAAEARRLSRLVDGLLTLARAEGVRPERQTIDVTRTLDERRRAWSPLAEERGITLSCTVPGTLRAWDVPGALDQVLDNLLANAIEATPDGSQVALSARARSGRVEISVLDEGPGMTLAERNRGFDRFWRRASGGDGGSGLGLAIVAQLVRSSGGEVELRAGALGGLQAVVMLELDRASGQP